MHKGRTIRPRNTVPTIQTMREMEYEGMSPLGGAVEFGGLQKTADARKGSINILNHKSMKYLSNAVNF